MWFPGVRSVHTIKMRCAIDEGRFESFRAARLAAYKEVVE